ncbi:hypothetical protein [Halorussus sp. MSC15.2]|uniref:hypothetical protein n=1 Tax=Halorussus sp. MSC15.2 TaxID=2283638 RepID=UPI0013D42178|nr:hypothetical protein [Halorussus sp. MSC15.2]NEU58561.1 hypothetical protein [Halorussus sp. MSC15.2]
MEDENQSKREESKNKASITRRGVLGVLGATAGATVSSGFTKPVSADSVDITDLRGSVRTLFEEVGEPAIVNQNVNVYHGDFTLKVIRFETKVGAITHREVLNSKVEKFDRGDTSTGFELKDLTEEIQRKLPTRFNSVPIGVELHMKVENNGMSLSTTVTEKEQEQLSNFVDTGEFIARHTDGSYFIRTADGNVFKVSSETDRPNIRQPSVEEVASEQINADACFDCGTNAPECASNCFNACAFVIGNGDPLHCGECIAQHCVGLDVKACAKCIASLPESIR